MRLRRQVLPSGASRGGGSRPRFVSGAGKRGPRPAG